MKHQDTTLVRDQFGQLFESKLLKGKYKERPNNPQRADGTIYEFCPPEQVEPEMERLLALHAEHEKRGVPVEVEAAWLHHRFTQIHPYQDGNGRVARALSSLLFIKAGWFPVVVTREDRPRYIDSLELGDEGNLRALVSFLVDAQKRTLFQSLQAAADIQDVQTVEGAIAAAKKVLTGPAGNLDSNVWLKAKATANRLMDFAAKRLADVSASLKKEIGKQRPEFQFILRVSGESTTPGSGELRYIPNRLDYQRGEALIIASRRETVIEVQSHAIGSKFRGLIGIVTYMTGSGGVGQLASKEPFQVNYAESYESAESRFRPWLEESLVNALTLWRKSL